MPLELVVNNPAQETGPQGPGVQGHPWRCGGCGGHVLTGSIVGARVRKGVLNMAADSCHVSEQLQCAGCEKVAAMKVNDRWAIVK